MNTDKLDATAFRLQFISHTTPTLSYLDGIRLALEGGCRWVQLRMKGATDAEVEPIARETQSLCRKQGATFIIDDRVELVKKLQADGVHLGKGDMPIAEARRILGDAYIIGGTANTLDDVVRHYHDGADYVGCGPYRFTTTKERLAPILGIEGYERIINGMRSQGFDIPVVAIGGITTADIPTILQTGVKGIAISGTILRAEDPVNMTRDIISIENQSK